MLTPEMVGLRSTTCHGKAPVRARGPLEAPLDNAISAWCSCGASGALALSLSAEEGRCLPLVVWQESWPDFR